MPTVEAQSQLLSRNREIFLLALREICPWLRSRNDPSIEKKIGKEKLIDHAEDLQGLIDSGINTTLTRNERIALSIQMMKCLEKYIKSMEMPVTIATVSSSFTLLHHAVDQAFPGYVESQLLKFTIQPVRK